MYTFGTVLLVLGIVVVTYFAVRTVLLKARTAADAEISGAKQQFPDALALFRDTYDYEDVNPDTGRTSRRLQLDVDLDGQRIEISAAQRELDRLESAPARRLQSAESALLAAEASVSAMHASVFQLESRIHEAERSIRLGITAGLLDAHGQVTPRESGTFDQDLADSVRTLREIVDSDFPRQEQDAIADVTARVDTTRSEIEDLKRQTAA